MYTNLPNHPIPDCVPSRRVRTKDALANSKCSRRERIKLYAMYGAHPNDCPRHRGRGEGVGCDDETRVRPVRIAALNNAKSVSSTRQIFVPNVPYTHYTLCYVCVN